MKVRRLTKVFALVLLITFQLFNVVKAEGTIKKVILHYHRFDGNYDEAGVWTWNNGTNGSADGVAKVGVDSFGAVIEISVNIADADKTGNFIPLNSGVAENTKQFPAAGDDAKDCYEKKDLSYDRSALIDGTVDELHIYFIEGNDRTFTNVDERSMFQKEGFGTLTVMYYDPKSDTDPSAYDNWDFWTWDTGTAGTGAFDGDKAIGVPYQWDLKYNGKTIKVGVINVAPDSQDTVGYIPKKGAWEAEWKNNGQDIKIDVTDIKGQGHKLLVYTAGDPDVKPIGAFSNLELVKFDVIKNTGTFAETRTKVNVELNNAAESLSKDHFTIVDNDGKAVEIASVEKGNSEGTKYILNLSNELDLTKQYTVKLKYNDKELISDLDIDNQPPLINYTKKKDYVLNKGDAFDVNDFIRLSAIDNRSGNLTDKMIVEGSVNTKKVGEYTLTYKAVDDWGNEGLEAFTFTVINSGNNNTIILIIGAVAILGVAAASLFVFKKKSVKK